MKPQRFELSRRQFLGQASCAAVGSTALASTLLNMLLTGSAAAQTGSNGEYRAMICLFLPGGNDSFNMLVPRGEAEYAEYAAVRGDLALARESLLPLSPLNNPGRLLGLHPGLPELNQLFDAGKLAFIANVGSLVRPTTKDDYQRGLSLPYGLFSHSDQQEQWQTSIPDTRAGIGWAGRAADLLRPMNAASPVSMNISISGNNLMQVGNDVVPYTVNSYGAVSLDGYGGEWGLDPIRTEAVDSLLAQEYANVLQSTYNSGMRGSLDALDKFRAATSVELPAGSVFPENGLGNSLKQIAKVIAGRNVLGVKRQTFYVQWGGWDFHDNVIENHQNMFPIVSKAIKAFFDTLARMGVENNVTLFTASDFGRSLTSNAKGSDHAWGGNHFIVGGSVRGKRIYGQYPELHLGSGLDAGRGNLIPTTSVDQYAAELALWLGVNKSDLRTVLPNIHRFYDTTSSAPPLGFLA